MAEPRIISWKVGRNFQSWHILGDTGAPWCGQQIPEHAALCELRSSPMLLLSELCRNCMISYAMGEAE